MAKITLTTLSSALASLTNLNANFSAIASDLNNRVLYRDPPDGEANQMEADLDMNSNDIRNVQTLYVDSITVAGEVLVPGDATTIPAGAIDTAALTDEAVTVAKMYASTTDVLFGRSTAGAGAGEEIPCTAAGRNLLDDANAAAQRTTLGLGTSAVLDKASAAEIKAAATGKVVTDDLLKYSNLIPKYVVRVDAAGAIVWRSDSGITSSQSATGRYTVTVPSAFASTSAILPVGSVVTDIGTGEPKLLVWEIIDTSNIRIGIYNDFTNSAFINREFTLAIYGELA